MGGLIDVYELFDGQDHGKGGEDEEDEGGGDGYEGDDTGVEVPPPERLMSCLDD
jgi:hypothetical protein